MIPTQPRKANPGLVILAIVLAAAIGYDLLVKRDSGPAFNRHPDAPTFGGGSAPARMAPRAIEQPPPVPDPSAGSRDWENPGPGPARFEFDAVRPNEITSSRTLDQTTRWIRWAMLQYGDSGGQINTDTRTIDAVINGCSIQWTRRNHIGDTNRVQDTITSMNLKDVDLAFGNITASLNQVRVQGLRSPGATVTEKFYIENNGVLTPDGDRSSSEGLAYINLAHRDHIEERVSWAAIHAAKLCGATASRDY